MSLSEWDNPNLWGDARYPEGFRRYGVCYRCGCRDLRPCFDHHLHRPCSWANGRFTLCSACAHNPRRWRYRRRRTTLEEAARRRDWARQRRWETTWWQSPASLTERER